MSDPCAWPWEDSDAGEWDDGGQEAQARKILSTLRGPERKASFAAFCKLRDARGTAPTATELVDDSAAAALRAEGNAAFKAKDFCRAVDNYSRAIERRREDPALYSNRAAAFLGMKRHRVTPAAAPTPPPRRPPPLAVRPHHP